MSREPKKTMKHVDHLLEHSEWLGALARHLVRDPSEAEDLVQETWAAALQGGPEDRTRARSWLGKVLRNFALLSFRRRERRRAREKLVATSESVAGPEESLQKLEILRLVVDLVLSLDDTLRDVVILRYFDGLSAAEIARRLDLKPSAIRMRLKRALDHLRAELDRRHDGDRSAWHAGLAIVLCGDANAPTGTVSSTGAPAPSPALAGLAGALLCLALSFSCGWLTRGSLPDSGAPPSPSLASSAERHDPARHLHELREVLRETRAILECESPELDSNTRLAMLEEIVHRLLEANPV